MYTTANTLNDIMNDEEVMAHFTFMMPLEFLEVVPKEMRGLSLEEIQKKVKMSWGMPYVSEGIVDVANLIRNIEESDEFSFIQLWSAETPSDFFPATDGEKMHVGLLKFNNSFEKNRKMAV